MNDIGTIWLDEATEAKLSKIQERTGHMTFQTTIAWLIRAEHDRHLRLTKKDSPDVK